VDDALAQESRQVVVGRSDPSGCAVLLLFVVEGLQNSPPKDVLGGAIRRYFDKGGVSISSRKSGRTEEEKTEAVRPAGASMANNANSPTLARDARGRED
jgi:hypothetical protein